MARALSTADRSDIGASAPIQRPRLVARLAALAKYPIALVLAPAGYGKSVAIRQYVATLSEPVVTFSLRPEHATLLGFLRGLTQALGENAPHASATLAGAYDANAGPKTRAAELAAWLHAHLESFSGLVIIDDFHVGDDDSEIAHLVTALVQRTKAKIRWILASRATAGLPIGTWLAYRDADLPLDEHDLRFTFEEARSAARGFGLGTSDEELEVLLDLTEGWPAALSFALRTSMRSSELRNVAAMTREVMYRLLAEQVYAELDDEERSLLEVASALPSIDIGVLERAGFDRALTIVEHLRERTSFIYQESAAPTYQCHDLFREFLRRQTAMRGRRSQQMVQQRAARALESAGDFEHAIAAFVAADCQSDVVRLLQKHGFDLLERARGDVVAQALGSLDEKARRENATLLALQGSLHAAAGRFSRAESFFRRALSRAGDDRDLVAVASLRLASLMANQGQDVTNVLSIVGDDLEQTSAHRAEALSLIAGQRAVAGDAASAQAALARLESLMTEVEADAIRAKVLHRVGIAFHSLGSEGKALQALTQSSELALEQHFYGIASRANAVLSNLALHEQDDVAHQLHYAELSTAAATKAGDAFALQTAQLQTLSARMRQGNIRRVIDLEQQLAAGRESELVARFLTLFRSLRLAWEARFSEAHRLLATCWTQLTFDFDRIVAGSEYALFLALDRRPEQSSTLAKEILVLIDTTHVTGLFRNRSLLIAKALCALAESINGRPSYAERIIRTVKSQSDPVIKLALRIVDTMVTRLRNRGIDPATDIKRAIEELSELGYADVANLLIAVDHVLRYEWTSRLGVGSLTASEVDVLRLLSEGFIPKDIAFRTGRSVYTVRAHIANAVAKLGCHGRSEAIRVAQREGLI